MEKDITENFARNFCDLMVDQGRTYDDLAEKAGISKATLSKYARDKQKPSAENAARIAQYFGVSMDELVGVTVHGTEDKTRYLPKAAADTLSALYDADIFLYWAIVLCSPNFLELIVQLGSLIEAFILENAEDIEVSKDNPQLEQYIRDELNARVSSDVWKHRSGETFRALQVDLEYWGHGN